MSEVPRLVQAAIENMRPRLTDEGKRQRRLNEQWLAKHDEPVN